MKKITFLFSLLITTALFAQTDLIENFDGVAPTLSPDNSECTALGLNIGTTQTTSDNSLEIISLAAGNPWQGAKIIPQDIVGFDLTSNKVMTVDVYSDTPFNLLAKATGGNGTPSATAAGHDGNGWNNLTFTFDSGTDNTSPADGMYTELRFYPLWGNNSTAVGYAGQGSTVCVSNAPITIYIDNIIGTLAQTPETCTDGIQNQDETGVDCGGSVCSPCGATVENLEDFEDATSFTNNGGAGANVVADPLDATNQVGQVISQAAGNAWQQADLLLQDNLADLSTNITVSVDVYATQSFTMMVKLEDTYELGSTTTAAAQNFVSGNGWQTLIFTYDQAIDNLGTADGEYGKVSFFGNWAGNGSGNNGTNPDWNEPLDFTFYVDNISAIAGTSLPIETCSDGIQNQDETGVDCGGVCGNVCAIPPSVAAPTPPERATENHVSMYSDSYTDQTISGFTVYDTAHQVADYDISGNVCVESTPNAPGNAFAYEYFDNGMNLTNLTTMHVDLYLENAAPEGALWQAKILQSPVGEAGDNIISVDLSLLTPGTWYQADVAFNTGSNASLTVDNVEMVQIFAAGTIGYTIYMDNIYFHNNDTSLGTTDLEVSKFSAYPNPTNDKWTISSTSEISNISLFDILGKQVQSLSPNNNEASIDASSLGTGIYFAKIQGVNGSKTLKLIKQ